MASHRASGGGGHKAPAVGVAVGPHDEQRAPGEVSSQLVLYSQLATSQPLLDLADADEWSVSTYHIPGAW